MKLFKGIKELYGIKGLRASLLGIGVIMVSLLILCLCVCLYTWGWNSAGKEYRKAREPAILQTDTCSVNKGASIETMSSFDKLREILQEIDPDNGTVFFNISTNAYGTSTDWNEIYFSLSIEKGDMGFTRTAKGNTLDEVIDPALSKLRQVFLE